MEMSTMLLIVVTFIAIATLLSSVRIIRQYEKGVVLRLGKYKLTVGPGVALVMPYIESVLVVDMREKVISVDPQQVITKDNVTVVVDCVIYYKVVDPVKAEFEVEDFQTAATTLAQTNLRNLIGDKSLDETLVARDVINTNLRDVLDEATHNWGVKVTRVEVQKIDPPEDITLAMSQQMKAEREKRASILQSEGIKESLRLEAEGKKMKAILEAEGQAEAVRKVAEATEKYFTPRAQLYKKLEVTRDVMATGTKWVLPKDSDVLSVLNLGDTDIVPVKGK